MPGQTGSEAPRYLATTLCSTAGSPNESGKHEPSSDSRGRDARRGSRGLAERTTWPPGPLHPAAAADGAMPSAQCTVRTDLGLSVSPISSLPITAHLSSRNITRRSAPRFDPTRSEPQHAHHPYRFPSHLALISTESAGGGYLFFFLAPAVHDRRYGTPTLEPGFHNQAKEEADAAAEIVLGTKRSVTASQQQCRLRHTNGTAASRSETRAEAAGTTT